MATLYGPKINNSGLILALDAGSQNSFSSGSTTWFDLSGNRNNGAVFNNPRYLTSNNGNILFTSGSYVQISSSATLSDLTVGSNITIMGWVNRTVGSGSWLPIISKVSSSGADNINYELAYTGTGSITASVNAYCFSYRNSSNTAFHGFSIDGGYEDDVWHHVAFTYTMATGSTARFYVDGVFASGSWKHGTGNEAPLNTNNGPIYIGKTNVDNEFFTGSMGALQVYNRILTADEILSNYNANKGKYGHPLPVPTVHIASRFIGSNVMAYVFTASRQLSNAYFLHIPQGGLWYYAPWTSSLSSSAGNHQHISRSLLGYGTNIGGQRYDIMAAPIGNLPAANYFGRILNPVGIYGNNDDTNHVYIIENTKQSLAGAFYVGPDSWTWNFGGSNTTSSSFGDMIVGYCTGQTGAEATVTRLSNVGTVISRGFWNSGTRYDWNNTPGSTTYGRISSTVGGNGTMFTVRFKQRK